MASSTLTATIQSDLRLLRFLSLATRLSTFLLIYLLSNLPLFDSSPRISSNDSPLLRWDTFHFAHIAQNGYMYEYEWAFFPGTPLVMRVAGKLLRLLKGNGHVSLDDLLQGGALAAFACEVGSITTLYQLTLYHLGSPHIALISSVLSLMPSSPAILRFAVYSEPFFTYFSYKGMLSCARSRYFSASIYFALAGTFRSNGILLSGFILWDMIAEPFLRHKHVSLCRFVYSVILTAITFAPFIYHHVSAYTTYCIPITTPDALTSPPKWCTDLPPSIYTHVQSKYWNSGFMRYWTLAQMPNFLISLPVYGLVLVFCGYHIRYTILRQLRHSRSSSSTLSTHAPKRRKPRPIPSSPFLSPNITPHAIHAFVLTLTILLTSHVQIILRLAASMPVTYWAGAWLVVGFYAQDVSGDDVVGKKSGRWGRWWVSWSFTWGMVSLVLWVAFLPPA